MTMKNRVFPGGAPDRTGPVATATISGASKELDRQKNVALADPEFRAEAIGEELPRWARFDLVAIWRAALADTTHPESIGKRRHMSPRRFVNGWSHIVRSQDEEQRGKLLVDIRAAVYYVNLLDYRVMEDSFNEAQRVRAERIAADPIAAGVSACKGGPLSMMIVGYKASVAAGMGLDEFYAAVTERTREMAEDMDPIDAETLVADVRKAIEGAPRLEDMTVPDPDEE